MTLPDIDPAKIEAVIRETAQECIVPRFRALDDTEIQTKTGPEDLVTAADIEAEEVLTAYFKKEFPGCGVLGEEAVSRGEVDLEAMKQNPPDLLWVIDPVDGTYNFARGSEIFACMVACVYKGETVMSWIFDVPKDKFASAQKGAGATYGCESVSTRDHETLEYLNGYAGRYYAPKAIRKIWEGEEQNVATLGGIRCAGHSYMRIARGIVDFHIYTHTKPWDHLAGTLLVQEAGGHVQCWDGSDYTLKNTGKGLLIGPNKPAWQNLNNLFLQKVLEEYGPAV